MEDQTNNIIREEKLNTLKSMLWELGHTNKDAHHVIEYVDELLKSQGEEERERIIKLIKKNKLHLGYANNIMDEINNGNITTR